MIKVGVSLIIVAIFLWIYLPLSAIFIDTTPNEDFILSAIAIGVIGGILILIGVSRDRYKEYKEDQENDDYRKY